MKSSWKKELFKISFPKVIESEVRFEDIAISIGPLKS